MHIAYMDVKRHTDLQERISAENGSFPGDVDARDKLALKKKALADFANFSQKAQELWNELPEKPVWDGSYSLDQLERRKEAVRQEISTIWNSTLPRDEKHRQIGARKNEIALLQAGQFTFARAMNSRTA